ncbi:Hint domain-containing protein [Novacetimonas hansenii]|uniref:Hint domain-containing protein n=2 Tax=Novacetimonas hansenii TaxID=436 RepID=A0AAW5EV74_NOVHA|nr:Hint domain-containing protein [Novacetimonas hansenii]
MIRTPAGDVAVENIKIGDMVVTWGNRHNTETLREVVWSGSQTVRVRPHLPDDEAGYPVRIVKDAIADGVPYKDMLITAEHCLFFDGKFVPVRMLVNGRSIFYDKSITSYDYYHIETAQHSVIMADGMLSESYLDTGNRRNFHQAGNVVRIGSSPRNWADDAAAPLAVNRDFVEPLFHRIGERAIASGHAPRSEPPIVETNADLHLVTKTGAVLRTMREANGHAFFMIPPGIEEVRIMSRTGRPSDMVGPYVDDRRHLGVLVRSIKLFEGNIARPVTSHLAPDAPAGWHDGGYMPCKEPCRWTDGQATLPLGHRHPTLMGLLCIEIIAGGPYNVEKDNIPQNDTRLTA